MPEDRATESHNDWTTTKGSPHWDFPDNDIHNTPALRAAIASVIDSTEPDVVVTLYGGAEWDSGMPNQRDHIEFAAAVTAAYDTLARPPGWLFVNGPRPTHGEVVDGYIDVAVDALAAHRAYLSVLDPATPVAEQARRQVDSATPRIDGHRMVEFVLERSAGQ